MKARLLYGFIAIAVLMLVMQGHQPLQAQFQDTMNLFDIVSPTPGQIIQGPTLPISVNFRTGDGVPVVRFDIYLNDKLFYGTKPYGGTLETPALEGRFNTDDAQSPANIARSGLKAGQATVTVRLTDAQGRIFSRSQLFVYQPIAPRQTTETNAPRVRILEPYNGQHIDAITKISVEALDDSGIVWIKILINDRMRAMGNTSPFTLDWDPIAEGYSVGSHYIMARAMDLFNNVGDSDAVIVYIDNPWSGDGLTRPQGDFDLLVKSAPLDMPKLLMGKAPIMPPLFSGSSRRNDDLNTPGSTWAIVPARILRPDKVTTDTAWVTNSGNDPVLLTAITPSNFALKSPLSTGVNAIFSSKLSTLLPPAFNGTITARRDIATGELSVLPIYLPNALSPTGDTKIAISQFLPQMENSVENIIPLQPMEIASQLKNNSDSGLPMIHLDPTSPGVVPALRQDIVNPAFTISLPKQQSEKPNALTSTADAKTVITQFLPKVENSIENIIRLQPTEIASQLKNNNDSGLPTIHLDPTSPGVAPTLRQDIVNPAFTISLPKNLGEKPTTNVNTDWTLTLPVVATTDDQVALWVPAQIETPLHTNTVTGTPSEFTATLNPQAIGSRNTSITGPTVTLSPGNIAALNSAPAVRVPLPGEMLTAPSQPVGINPIDNLKSSYIVKSGDTLTSIARNLSTTTVLLAQLNPTVKPANIAPGEKLVVPHKRMHMTLDNMDISASPSPYIAGRGYTMVSMRSLVEAKAGVIIWVPKTRQVNAWVGNNAMKVTIGKREASINSELFMLPIAAAISEERTMVPLRFMMQGMKLSLEYDQATAQYVLTSNTD